MAIIGSLIKGAIQIKDALSGEVNHLEAQEKVLHQLLDKAKGTEFGKKFDFASILESDDIKKDLDKEHH